MAAGSRDRIIGVIYATIDELDVELEPGARLQPSPDTLLYGEQGQLDSLKLVELLVETEQRIEDEFGVWLTLADEHALARRANPFRSVASLAEYIEERLEGEGT
ncbi:MAG: acyl carrier protein [Acidimicrobiales bacterium]